VVAAVAQVIAKDAEETAKNQPQKPMRTAYVVAEQVNAQVVGVVVGFNKTAQQSVQPTGGILRRFQAFFLALGFSCSQAESQPTHQRLTQTVGRVTSEPKSVKIAV
jgi:hypothetical protein